MDGCFGTDIGEPITSLLIGCDSSVDSLIENSIIQNYNHAFPVMQSGKTEIREERSAGNQDLLSITAATMLVNGGRVNTLPKEDIQEGSIAAAILRY